jgi:hypothetical protein
VFKTILIVLINAVFVALIGLSLYNEVNRFKILRMDLREREQAA